MTWGKPGNWWNNTAASPSLQPLPTTVRVVVRQVRPQGQTVTALAGDGGIVPVTDGGWSVVARPKRTGFLEWAGNSPATMDVPLILDGFTSNRSVEAEIRALEGMKRNRVGPDSEPAVVEVKGSTIPLQNLQWVINGIAYGEVYRRDTDGARVRQTLTLNLVEYVEADVLGTKKSAPKRAKERNKKGSGGKKTYKVKHGDSLQSIAAKQLGDRSKWHEIAKLNNLRDPKAIKVGQTLVLP